MSQMLSLREDNEHTTSQAFSCRSVVLSVYVCLCAHVSAWTGMEISHRASVFVLNLCVLAKWQCWGEGSERRTHWDLFNRADLSPSADCLDNITRATMASSACPTSNAQSFDIFKEALFLQLCLEVSEYVDLPFPNWYKRVWGQL